jgi:MGT family glycosyltransferase
MFKALKLNIEMTLDKLEYNLDEIKNENPDYIIHDSLCTWGKHAASILDKPAVNLMHSFPVTESSIPRTTEMIPFLFQLGIYKINNSFSSKSPNKILKKKYSIALSMSDVLINREELNIVYNSKYMALDIYKAEKTYKFVGPSLFFRQEQDDFPYNKINGKKVIYISLGTLNNRKINFYRTCIRAFLNKEYFIIISTGYDVDINELGDVPEYIIIRQNVPQQRLLEFADLFITHAGMNSVNESICYGVPMLLFPLQFEQKMIAERVQELGMGIVKKMSRINPEKLFEISKRIISDGNYDKQLLKYQTLFSQEEQTSHTAAADHILEYIKNLNR